MVISVITFAHRGAQKEAPENTLPAFRRALELGATGLETDVWLSADGEVVCTHDATVAGRTAPAPDLRHAHGDAGDAGRPAPRRRLRGARHRLRAVGRREGAGRRARAGRRRPPLRRARAALGVLAERDRARRAPRRPRGEARALDQQAVDRGTARTARPRARRARHRRDQPAPHRVDRRPRLAVPPLRRARFAWDTQEVRQHPRGAAHGHRRGLLRPPRPHGRGRRRVVDARHPAT